jgi:hypothetical protein
VLVDLLPRAVLAKRFAPRNVPWIIQTNHGGQTKPFLSQLLGLLEIKESQIIPYEVLASGQASGNLIDTNAAVDDSVRLAVDEMYLVDWEHVPGQDLPVATANSATAMRHCPPRYALTATREWAHRTVFPPRSTHGNGGQYGGGAPPKETATDTAAAEADAAPAPASAPSEAGAETTAGQRRRTVVFVSRSRADTRKLNESQELRILQQLAAAAPSDKWHVMVYSDRALPPIADTIRLFASAAVIVGVHGAGLSHILFAQEHTQVVEIALPEPHAHYFQHLSAALGLGYEAVVMAGQGRGLYGAKTLPYRAVDEAAVVCAVARAMAAFDATAV